jgi:hypothetical protein
LHFLSQEASSLAGSTQKEIRSNQNTIPSHPNEWKPEYVWLSTNSTNTTTAAEPAYVRFVYGSEKSRVVVIHIHAADIHRRPVVTERIHWAEDPVRTIAMARHFTVEYRGYNVVVTAPEGLTIQECETELRRVIQEHPELKYKSKTWETTRGTLQ